ncbi:MAG: alpha/beta hydrolase family protein [Granulosicoccus sp.]
MLRSKLCELIGGWPEKTGDAGASVRRCASLHRAEVSAANADVRKPETSHTASVVEWLEIHTTRPSPLIGLSQLPAVLVRPDGEGPFPAVVYCHAHGGRYDIGKKELLEGREALPCGNYASALVNNGIAAICIDLPCFGERVHDIEQALCKRLHWHGDTLFGVMLRELAVCVDYLQSRDDIDTTRIGAMGMSMGSTLSWWLAALDERVKLVAELCCLSDLHTLVREGGYIRHGPYMTVPGLLNETTTGEINALIAPRAHFCAVGLQDVFTPERAFNVVDEYLKECYAHYGQPEHWQTVVSPHTAHEETQAMRSALLRFLRDRL